MKISTKLYSAVGALALTGAIVAGVGRLYLGSLGEELSLATGKTAIKLDLVNGTRARAWEMIAANRGMFISASINDTAALEARAGQFKAALKRTHEQVTQIRPLLTSERARADMDRYETALREFETVSADFARLCSDHKLEQVALLVPRVQAFAGVADSSLGDIRDQQRAFLKDSQARAEALKSQSLFVSLLMACILLAIVVIAVAIVRGINRTLISAINELQDGAGQVSAAASQVASSSQCLAQGSTEQAASLEETSASSEQISSMAAKGSENCQEAAGLVASAQQGFAGANQCLVQMTVAMGEINTQSDKIARIIKVIDAIAFQTNILALNAAVEAARAGDAGLGFAVVAGEVRNLAQRCAEAASDTSQLIADSIDKASGGKSKLDQVTTAIGSITGDIAKLKVLVDAVTVGSQEQTRGIEQVSKAVVQMQQVTQSTAAGAEEGAAAAEELSAQSEVMKQVVANLSQMVGGK